MADLDDFFAKKDKKKSKTTTKRFATPEEVAKKLDDTSKRVQELPKPRKERPANSAEGEDSSNSEQRHEDEWKEFEEEERKDYTGLKIGQLQINDNEQLQANSGTDGDYGNDGGSDGEGGTIEGGRKHGPWKPVVSPEDVTQLEAVVEPTPNEKTTSKIYISPALRNQLPSRIGKVRNRTAPDLTNEDYFPTLGAARPEEQRKKKNEPAFEEVRHGGRITRVQEIQNAPVSVGNRFKTLADDDS